MDDLKEDLLDTLAVLKNRLSSIGFASWLLLLVAFGLWPLFYLLMAFTFVKLVISFSGTIYLIYLLSIGREISR
tara:strand:- start:496 stop:717 length:222 start_codon:yes stop_codon:yes gene_type:complete